MNQYEIERNVDGSIQLRLHTPEGFVDLVFEHAGQFIMMVAGQHIHIANLLLKSISKD